MKTENRVAYRFLERCGDVDPNVDSGGRPYAINIEEKTVDNEYYRIADWTGGHLQMTLMSIEPGGVIDLERHSATDQFIRVEKGDARVRMGETKDNFTYEKDVSEDWAFFVPAGYWHKVENTGENDLKLYSIYAPPEHEWGTIHEEYEDAE